MTVNAPLVATPSQTVGPFFHVGLVATPSDSLAEGMPPAHRIRLLVSVVDGDGNPVDDGVVELWQAVSAPPDATADGIPPLRFARRPTGADGTCEFDTVRPGRMPDGMQGLQAPHINVCLFARGLLRQLHTRIYFAGDPALADDAALRLVPENRRGTLLATPDPGTPGRWLFAIRLQGAQETVFFDV